MICSRLLISRLWSLIPGILITLGVVEVEIIATFVLGTLAVMAREVSEVADCLLRFYCSS